jgi:hypothetical protein
MIGLAAIRVKSSPSLLGEGDRDAAGVVVEGKGRDCPSVSAARCHLPEASSGRILA